MPHTPRFQQRFTRLPASGHRAHIRLWTLSCVAALAVALSAEPGQAQPQTQPQGQIPGQTQPPARSSGPGSPLPPIRNAPGEQTKEGTLAVPIEIEMGTVNGEVTCGRREIRLPAGDVINLHVINQSETSLRFTAPQFLTAAEAMSANHPTIDPATGGFMVGARSKAELVLRTPPPGDYAFACNEIGKNPRMESTGYLIVLPGPRP